MGDDAAFTGEVVNPETGKSNTATFELVAEGLKLSGCAGIICASRLWTRG